MTIFDTVLRADFVTGETARSRPILMSAPMVRAILARTKTQTRRVIAAGKFHSDVYRVSHLGEVGGKFAAHLNDGAHGGLDVICPYGKKFDQLWVRETFMPDPYINSCASTIYRSTEAEADRYAGHKWKPSIFMPRSRSRITLEITAVRVERLQDISATDCIAEGIDYEQHKCGCEVCAHTSVICPASSSSLIMAYAELWESINGKRSWALNPWVWVVEFGRVKP